MNLDLIRKRRVFQLTLGVQVSILLAASVEILQQNYLAAIAMLGICLSLGAVLWLSKGQRINLAANLLVFLIFILLCYLVIIGTGLRDIALFGFPGLIIFSTMIGHMRLTYNLLITVVIFLFALGIGYSTNLIPQPELTTNLSTAISLAIILLITGYAIITLHKDLVSATKRIRAENQRVKESEEALQYLAHHDPLTQLPNRILAKDRFEHALSSCARKHTRVAVLYLDLDNFKNINDTLGHSIGDELLQQVAKELQSICRKEDTICRLGGDEFMIIAEQLSEPWQVARVAIKVLKTLGRRFDLETSQVSCSTSIGIAISPDDGTSFEEVLKKADLAMYQAKHAGRNQYQFFNENQQKELEYRIKLTSELSKAIEQQEFELHYQAKINLKTGLICGAEALLRWNNSAHGIVSPDTFIPLAEQSGNIIPIGEWVTDRALRDLPEFLQHIKNFHLGINVSVAQFHDPYFIDKLEQKLNELKVGTEFLEIEITESLLIDQEGDLKTKLERLRAMGLHLSIDDFGTGYSNLGYLKHFDVETLKIDRSFILNLAENEYNQTIVRAILQICNELKMTTVAEGVEDPETSNMLAAMGCHMGQGYLWSKPVPKETLLSLLKAQQQTPVEVNTQSDNMPG